MQRADKRKFHYIYKITRDDGKYYIGMHSTDELEDGYFGSGKLITRSIKKYGVERHAKEILEFLPSRIELKDRERQLVNEEILDDPKCMNLRLGGDGDWTIVNRRLTPEQRTASGKAGGFANKTLMSEQGLANYRAGIVNGGKTAIKKNSCDWTGRHHSSEAKAKIAQSMKGKQHGEKNSQFGSCWVTDGVKPVKIKKEQLEEYLSKGYSLGRKLST